MIIRRKHNGNFTVIGNEPMNDESLSAEALGVLCYLRSRPDNWKVIPDQLATRFNCGRNRMYRILKEIIDGQYMTRIQSQDQKTKIWSSSEYFVYDEAVPTTSSEPRTENRDTVEPCTQKPHPQKPRTENRDSLLKTDLLTITDREQKLTWPSDYQDLFWNFYPRRVGKRAALKALDRVKSSGKVEWSALLAALQKFNEWAATKEIQYVKHPATWLNAGCWDDELTSGEFRNGSPNSASAAASRLIAQGFRLSPKPGSPAYEASKINNGLLPQRRSEQS